MIAKISNMFQRRHPQRDAALALARITTLSGMGSLPWDSGVYADRRAQDEVQASIGVWFTPVVDDAKADTLSLGTVQQAVCCDVRAEGFGVLSPVQVEGQALIVAVPNGGEADAGWKFFVASCCHQTPRPGGWFLLGLQAERIYEPTSIQRQEFRAAIGEQ
jgi:hypothetical protein